MLTHKLLRRETGRRVSRCSLSLSASTWSRTGGVERERGNDPWEQIFEELPDASNSTSKASSKVLKGSYFTRNHRPSIQNKNEGSTTFFSRNPLTKSTKFGGNVRSLHTSSRTLKPPSPSPSTYPDEPGSEPPTSTSTFSLYAPPSNLHHQPNQLHRTKPFKSSYRPQSMTAHEISAFDEMFNLLFDSVGSTSSTSNPIDTHSTTTATANLLANPAFHHHQKDKDKDKESKKLRELLPRKLTALEEAELDAKKEKMEGCKSDWELLGWVERELFIDSLRRLREFEEASKANSGDPKPHLPLPEIQSPLYPALLTHALSLSLTTFTNPSLTITLFTHASHLSLPSFIHSCRTAAFNIYLRALWAHGESLEKILSVVEWMRGVGVKRDGGTRGVIGGFRRDVEDALKSVDVDPPGEGVEGGGRVERRLGLLSESEIFTLLERLDVLCIQQFDPTENVIRYPSLSNPDNQLNRSNTNTGSINSSRHPNTHTHTNTKTISEMRAGRIRDKESRDDDDEEDNDTNLILPIQSHTPAWREDWKVRAQRHADALLGVRSGKRVGMANDGRERAVEMEREMGMEMEEEMEDKKSPRRGMHMNLGRFGFGLKMGSRAGAEIDAESKSKLGGRERERERERWLDNINEEVDGDAVGVGMGMGVGVGEGEGEDEDSIEHVLFASMEGESPRNWERERERGRERKREEVWDRVTDPNLGFEADVNAESESEGRKTGPLEMEGNGVLNQVDEDIVDSPSLSPSHTSTSTLSRNASSSPSPSPSSTHQLTSDDGFFDELDLDLDLDLDSNLNSNLDLESSRYSHSPSSQISSDPSSSSSSSIPKPNLITSDSEWTFDDWDFPHPHSNSHSFTGGMNTGMRTRVNVPTYTGVKAGYVNVPSFRRREREGKYQGFGSGGSGSGKVRNTW